MRLPGSNPDHALSRRDMAKASHSLVRARPPCLGPASVFSPLLCSAGASAVPRMCLGKSLIFLICACCAYRSEASHRGPHHVAA